MSQKMKKAFFLPLFAFFLACCDEKSTGEDGVDLTGIPFSPTAYTIKKPAFFPEMDIPADNPMTAEGIALGRKLFYDPILSGDSTQSCASCHAPAGSFTDNQKTSKGIDGIAGRRSSMPLLNVGWVSSGLFWDGRAKTLEDQALLPVEDPIEMHATWPTVVERLQNSEMYRTDFRKAFGVSNSREIDKFMAAKALAQFERTMISSGKSKYDRFIFGGELGLFDDDEIDGRLIFFDLSGGSLPDGECFHCHGPGDELLGSGQFQNNGLQNFANPADFPDKGRGEVTQNFGDFGKFRAPALRNIAFSAPFMHDGRLATLEEVIEHYASGGHYSDTKNSLIYPLGNANTGPLTAAQKKYLVKFLRTLDDPDFMNNPELGNPF